MAFPTIPTTAANRILTAVQADTVSTRSFPDLSGLTKNAGDLLIAICIVYQSSAAAGAVFSGWSAGWTEFCDKGGTTSNHSIGAAYKWSTGSETGVITVTQAATITGHAVMILMSIPGAHATTPPEAGAIVNGTTAAADPASFDPAGWAAEDTLWIAVGACGETSTTGSFTGIGGAPTNYTNGVQTGISADVVGGLEGAVAFRQLNASAEDVGTRSVDISNARNSALVIAVRPVAPTQTSVAQLSLAGASTPLSQTAHKIHIRARVTSGAGTIRAALYESINNRSGDLESSALTTSLADYTLPIPDANAANITDYSNLEIRIWGYAAGGGSIVFEVDQVYLEIPGAASTPKSGTDSSGGTTAVASIGILDSTGANGTTTEAIAGRTEVTTDASAGTVATGVISEVTADVNGATTETASIGVPISASDANGTVTEAVASSRQITDANGTDTETVVISITTSDTNGATTEAGSLPAIQKSSSDSGGVGAGRPAGTFDVGLFDVSQFDDATGSGTIGETASVAAAKSGTDTNGSTTETASVRISVSDANSVITEIVALRQINTDANGTITESASTGAPVSSSDANGAIIESAKIALSAADTNGTTIESSNVSAPVSSSDSNGATTEATMLRITAGDTGSVAEVVSTFVVISTSDSSTSTVEITSQNLSVTDSNSGIIENMLMKYTVTDANSGETENGTTNTPISGTDVSGGSVEDASVPTAILGSSDVGLDSESVSVAVPVASSDISGTASETATPLARINDTDSNTSTVEISAIRLSSSDMGNGVELPLRISVSAVDSGTAIEIEAFQAFYTSTDASGGVVETTMLIAPGILGPNAPHWMLSAILEQAKLLGMVHEEAKLISVELQPAILERAVHSWRP